MASERTSTVGSLSGGSSNILSSPSASPSSVIASVELNGSDTPWLKDARETKTRVETTRRNGPAPTRHQAEILETMNWRAD